MSNNIAEQYTRNGLEVKIFYDVDPEDPLEWTGPEDRLGQVHYALNVRGNELPWEIDADTADFDGWQELAAAVTAKDGELPGYNYKFVRWYEHSGVAVSLRDNTSYGDFDAGCAGVVFGETTKDIEQQFKPWAAYVAGQVYGYDIINPKDGEFIDSCSGFYGYEEAQEAANSAADAFEWPHDAKYAKTARELHR